MFEYLPEIVQVFSLVNIALMVIGLFIGIVFGAIPGLTGNLAIVLCIPMTFSLDTVTAFILLLSIYVGGKFGGSISAIMIGTPGTNSAACTMIDGYPMAVEGKANKALTTALVASGIGGVISAISLIIFAPMIASVAIEFGPAEYFTLAIFGISIIAGVSGDSIVKGIIVACFGFLVSCVGLDSLTAVQRFTFGNISLMSGIPMMPMMLGVFAINRVLEKINTKDYEDTEKLKLLEINKNDKFTMKDLFTCLPTIIKSAIIGVVVGATPGAGGSIASFLSYSEAKRASKTPEVFGKGAIEGVAASESGNSSVTGATLIPMLTLGIPGGAAAATLMGAFMMHGLPPGPRLIVDDGATVYTIMFGLLLANILLFVEGKLLAKIFARISLIPQTLLVPIIMVFCLIGSYASSSSISNLYVSVGFGFFAYFLGKLKFPAVPIIIGYLLGDIAESNLRGALVISEGSWMIFLEKPICVVFIILTIVMLFTFAKTNKRAKQNMKKLEQQAQ